MEMNRAGAVDTSSVAQSFADLFPPLVATKESALEREVEPDVDIDVHEIALRPLEQEVDSYLYEALQRWNDAFPTSGESTMPYMQRLKRYRAIVRWMLYENEDADPEDEVFAPPTTDDYDNTDGGGGASTSERRRLRQQRKFRQKQINKYKSIFRGIPPIDLLRELRRPPSRFEPFLDKFPVKKRLLLTKRSVADTQTALCFEFARRPSTGLDLSTSSGKATTQQGGDQENAASQETVPETIQRPTATTAATWRSRTLLASVEQQRQAEELQNPQPVAVETPPELLLWVDVLHPSKDPARTQSFLVRGSQQLHELLDLVVCGYDQRFDKHARQAKLLYFDHLFYVDRRHVDNADYATNILAWLYAKPSRVDKYLGPGPHTSVPVKTMETTTFAELALKVDLPGVYIHQGECEHLVRLRDVRLYNAATDSDKITEDFPLRLPNPHTRQLRSCLVCANYSAKFVCYGDRMSVCDPMFFCERCYKAAHYDTQGRLLYADFQAFPYIQE